MRSAFSALPFAAALVSVTVLGRGHVTITDGVATATITAGTDYTAPTNADHAFVVCKGTYQSSAGNQGGNRGAPRDSHVYVSDPNNLGTSITFERIGTVGAPRVYWEVIENTDIGGNDEWIVREAGAIDPPAGGVTEIRKAVTGIANDADVLVMVTGQMSSAINDTDFDGHCDIITDWDGATDEAVFTGFWNDADLFSYVVIEFVGSNYGVERLDVTPTLQGTEETFILGTALDSLDAGMLYTCSGVAGEKTQHRTYEAWISSTTEVSVRHNNGAAPNYTDPVIAWVIRNPGLTVNRYNGSYVAGANSVTITTVAELSRSSVWGLAASEEGGFSWPGSFIGAKLVDASTMEVYGERAANTPLYRAEVVEWPEEGAAILDNGRLADMAFARGTVPFGVGRLPAPDGVVD